MKLQGKYFCNLAIFTDYLTNDDLFVYQEFYLDLRKQQEGPDSTPVTTRQLEAMIRLTEVSSIDYLIVCFKKPSEKCL